MTDYNPREIREIPKIGVPTIGIPKISLPNAFGKVVREEKKDDGHDYGYIRDGLVFHLDGINKGSNPNAWTDLVGGVVFENHGATPIYNGWMIDNPADLTQYLHTNFPLDYPFDKHTIEITFVKHGAYDKKCIIFQSGAINSVAAGYIYDNRLFSGKQGNNTQSTANDITFKWNPNVGTLDCLSSACDIVIYNKIRLSKTNVLNAWDTPQPKHAMIGGRYNSSSAFSGIIHSIRIYNRLLTEEEMLHNQAVDYKRFDFENASHNAATARINNLNEVNSPQNIVFPSTIYNSLSEEEIALATSKGWSVVSE